MSDNEFEWVDVDPITTVYANTRGEIEELAERIEAVDRTKIYIGDEPHDGLATDRLENLDEWR